MTSVSQLSGLKINHGWKRLQTPIFLLFLGSSLEFELLRPALFSLQAVVDANNELRFGSSSCSLTRGRLAGTQAPQ